jgi:hypothetical protein
MDRNKSRIVRNGETGTQLGKLSRHPTPDIHHAISQSSTKSSRSQCPTDRLHQPSRRVPLQWSSTLVRSPRGANSSPTDKRGAGSGDHLLVAGPAERGLVGRAEEHRRRALAHIADRPHPNTLLPPPASSPRRHPGDETAAPPPPPRAAARRSPPSAAAAADDGNGGERCGRGGGSPAEASHTGVCTRRDVAATARACEDDTAEGCGLWWWWGHLDVVVVVRRGLPCHGAGPHASGAIVLRDSPRPGLCTNQRSRSRRRETCVGASMNRDQVTRKSRWAPKPFDTPGLLQLQIYHHYYRRHVGLDLAGPRDPLLAPGVDG